MSGETWHGLVRRIAQEYEQIGTCISGCYSEPACITEEPGEGWPSYEEGREHVPEVPAPERA